MAEFSSKRSGQRGAVLILAMVFMLMLAVVAGTLMQTSILQFFMAGNEQASEEAFQQAHAIVSELTEDIDNFPVTGEVGYTICPSVAQCADSMTTCPTTCNARMAADPNSLGDLPDGVTRSFSVVRRGPRILEALPFRQGESEVSGVRNFDAALFEASVSLDGSDVRLGSAEVVYGVAIRISGMGQ